MTVAESYNRLLEAKKDSDREIEQLRVALERITHLETSQLTSAESVLFTAKDIARRALKSSRS